MKRLAFRTILFALAPMLNRTAAKHPQFRATLREHDCTVQIRLKDRSLGRHFVFHGGRVKAHAGLCARPDVDMVFKNVDTALMFMRPSVSSGGIRLKKNERRFDLISR